jgi:hypothetical protein
MLTSTQALVLALVLALAALQAVGQVVVQRYLARTLQLPMAMQAKDIVAFSFVYTIRGCHTLIMANGLVEYQA